MGIGRRPGPRQASSRDDHGARCQDRRVAGPLERLRRGWGGEDRRRGQGGERTGGADRLAARAGFRAGPDRLGGRPLVAVAVRRPAGRGLRRGALGDAARAGRLRGDAGEDGPEGRPRDRPADAAGVVRTGALQVDPGAGDPGAAETSRSAWSRSAGPTSGCADRRRCRASASWWRRPSWRRSTTRHGSARRGRWAPSSA